MHRRVHLLATNVGAQAVGVSISHLEPHPWGAQLELIPTRHHMGIGQDPRGWLKGTG